MRNIIQKILKNRLALSTVITTLIILVVAVLLAGVVTYFAINVVSTRVQQESLTISQAYIWVTPAGVTQGALQITNTGGRDVVINRIEVRGQAVTIASNVYFVVDTTAPSAALQYEATITTGTVAGASVNSLTLPSGDTIIVYIPSPDSVSINDIGQTIGVTVFTAQAMYYKETNVQVS